MKKQEELFELRKIKLMSENTITGKNKITGEDTIEMLKKMGLVEGKDFETIERDGKRIIKTLRGVEIAEGTGLMTIIKEVENVCNERLRVVLDDTKLRDMTTQEFLEIYEKYKSLSEEDREKYLPKSFLEAMK